MKPAVFSAMRWGVVIGLINLVWLYLAYFAGLHTSGVMWFQAFMLVWLVLTVMGFFIGIRSIRRNHPYLTYFGGLVAGIVAALMSAIIAVVAQVGYFTVVHPEWPNVMAEQTRQHFTEQGLSEGQIEQMVEQARNYFTLSNYCVSSFFAALIPGAVLSAIFMAMPYRRSGPEAVKESTAD